MVFFDYINSSFLFIKMRLHPICQTLSTKLIFVADIYIYIFIGTIVKDAKTESFKILWVFTVLKAGGVRFIVYLLNSTNYHILSIEYVLITSGLEYNRYKFYGIATEHP